MTDTTEVDQEETSSAPVPEATPWPEQVFVFADVQEWVSTVLGQRGAEIDLRAVYAAYTDPPDQRVTARLAVRDGTGTAREIVFKGNRAAHLAGSARAHALVSRHCRRNVPQIIAWDEGHAGPGSSRLLQEPFEGRSVGKSGDTSLLLEMARTIAHIQKAVAQSGEAEGVGLPRIVADDIPGLFASVFDHVQAHVAAWQQDDGGKLSQALGAPSRDILEILDTLRPAAARCAETVMALDLPVTIDHGDLHGGNAVVQADETILIYDWETATVGCPLFSLEKLLVSAWSMDANNGGNGPWGYVGGTPTQARVQEAYLDALGQSDITPDGFASAMGLAVVKEMHAEIAWANRVGWPDGNPEWTAQLVRRLRFHLVDIR